MNRATIPALLIAVLPSLAPAQPLPAPHANAVERAQDRRELRDGRRDLAHFRQLLARYDAARARRHRGAIAAVEKDVARALDVEIREARVELARSRNEVRRDGFERDDRRDLRDDRRDARRIVAIDQEFSRLRGRLDRRSMDRKRALLAEVTRMSRVELAEDRRELREDRRDDRPHR